MGLLAEKWEAIKAAARTLRPVEYAKDKDGKEIKFSPAPRKVNLISKHDASKAGHKHAAKVAKVRKTAPTNHERVVAIRAKRQGLTVKQYQAKYQ